MLAEIKDDINTFLYNEEKLRLDPKANAGRPYQQCTVSAMDTISDPAISFDEKGISNYYHEYQEAAKHVVTEGDEPSPELAGIVQKIKESGAGKPYDCITGVSGGVDSTYLTLQAKKLGLRPLVVHFDNGWNSELAVKNIENIISRLEFDLYTLVVNWEEFRDLQLAYLKASVVDIEAITDHAIIATLYKLAIEKNIKYILSGTNIVTEATLPAYWVFNKNDHINIRSIHKEFGSVKLKTYPFYNTRLKKMAQLRRIESVNLLNYLPYNKQQVKQTIIRELGWKDYGGKHYESIFTRFYQGYILPKKFHIDKRKAHVSNLVFSGQITREDAFAQLQTPIYDPEQLASDYEFMLKKFGLTKEEFEKIMKLPRREHTSFETEKGFFSRYPLLTPAKPIISLLRRLRK
ncbi:MAG: N-acetyl sugar amidotransferase [Chitinophagaceae bacterium]